MLAAMLETRCPGCDKRIKFRDENMGRKLVCPNCKGGIDTKAAQVGTFDDRPVKKPGRPGAAAGARNAGVMANLKQRLPFPVYAAIVGAMSGIMAGIIFGVITAVLLTVAASFIDTSTLPVPVGGAIAVVVTIVILLNGAYYGFMGACIGLAGGLVQAAWACYAVAAIFIVGSYFLLGGFSGVIFTILFTGGVIKAVDES